MTDRSSSTRTHGFLFADLRDYTSFVERRGDQAATELLRAYRALVREILVQFDGAEIKTEGDSFYVVFTSVGSAVRCALAIQERAAEATASDPQQPIAVGIGIHAGETTETSEGYVGSAVNIAARVCGLAKAGEVLVTDTVRALTRAVVDVTYQPRGTRQLKGVGEPIAIFRAVPVGSAAALATSKAGTRARPGRRSVASVGAVAAFAALLLAAALLGGRSLFGSSPTPTPSPTAGTASTGTSPSPTPSGGLTAAEADLRDRIPSSIRASCGPTPAAERTVKTIASLVCSPDPGSAEADRIWYEAFDPASRAALSPAFFAIANGNAIPHGDCSKSAKAWSDWSLPGTYAGERLCYTDSDGRAWVAWTYDVQRILVRAERLDGDRVALFRWSESIAELLN
jgi:class 3 adenylate cyclase